MYHTAVEEKTTEQNGKSTVEPRGVRFRYLDIVGEGSLVEFDSFGEICKCF
jgi:hypothetical protein